MAAKPTLVYQGSDPGEEDNSYMNDLINAIPLLNQKFVYTLVILSTDKLISLALITATHLCGEIVQLLNSWDKDTLIFTKLLATLRVRASSY